MYEGFIIVAMSYLIFKHFVCDFPKSIQTPWMFLNKGTYGHPGGIVHAAIHAVMSAPVFIWAASWSDWWAPAMWHGLEQGQMVLALMVFEFLVHYHMDWWKMWWCARRKYKPDTHAEFWTWLGIDQMVHYFTYVAMITAWVV